MEIANGRVEISASNETPRSHNITQDANRNGEGHPYDRVTFG